MMHILAMVSMTVDHCGAYWFRDAMWMRAVGRLAYPLFCVLVAEGIQRSHNVESYIARLYASAVVAQVVLMLMGSGSINVLFSFIGSIYVIQMAGKNKMKNIKDILKVVVVLIMMVVVDYGLLTISIISIYYVYKNSTKALVIGSLVIVIYSIITNNMLQVIAVMSLIMYKVMPELRINIPKTVRYAYYPGHLACIALTKTIFS